jgi:hypothetical protein
MSGSKKGWPAAVVAGGIVALAALIGCGGEESVASKSAAAFQEAQKRGETFGGEGHSHGGHGDMPPGGEPSEPMQHETATGEEHPAGHGRPGEPTAAGMQHQDDHGSMSHAQGAHAASGGESPADHSAMGHGGGAQAGGHAAMGHGGSASPGRSGQSGQSGDTEEHAGHGTPAAQPSGGHAGHSMPEGGTPPAPGPELPTQPASILQPDPVDAPAATSVMDAQRSAEMNQAMSGGGGGHGGHGAGTYRQVDAGRGPGAYEGSEPQTPGAGPQHHDHGAAEPAVAPNQEQEAVYACPMHPEVSSKAPGTCPKCGMTLVKRSKG